VGLWGGPQISLTKECGWKEGDRGGPAQTQNPLGEKRKTDLTLTGLLMEGLGRGSIAFRIKIFSGASSLCPEKGKVMMRKNEGQIGNSG